MRMEFKSKEQENWSGVVFSVIQMQNLTRPDLVEAILCYCLSLSSSAVVSKIKFISILLM